MQITGTLLIDIDSNGNEELSDLVVKVKSSLDMWSAFLTRNDLLRLDNLPKELNNPTLKKAISVLEVMNFSDEERNSYEDHLKWLMIEASTVKKAEEKAEARGKAEGKAEEKMALVRNSLKAGLPLETISSITGLSVKEIEKLKSS